MKDEINQLINGYIENLANGKKEETGELSLNILSVMSLDNEEHRPVPLNTAQSEERLHAKEEASYTKAGAQYSLPELCTIWDRYLLQRETISAMDLRELQREMLLVIVKDFFAKKNFEVRESFTSQTEAYWYYLDRLREMADPEAHKLREALLSLHTRRDSICGEL